MRLLLNEEELDFTLENEKVSLDIYNAMVELSRKNEAVVTGITIDGEVLTQENFQSLMSKSVEDVEVMEFSTVLLSGLFDLLTEMLPEGGEIFSGLESLSAQLQTGKVKESSKTIQEIANLMEIVIYVFNCCGNFPEKFISEKIGDQDFKEFFNGFMAVLPEFLDSFENKDYVLLGDLAEYEILPRLKALSAFASKMGGKA